MVRQRFSKPKQHILNFSEFFSVGKNKVFVQDNRTTRETLHENLPELSFLNRWVTNWNPWRMQTFKSHGIG